MALNAGAEQAATEVREALAMGADCVAPGLQRIGERPGSIEAPGA
jgi:hypothetical protein